MAVKYFNLAHHEKNMLNFCYIYYIPTKVFAVCVCYSGACLQNL